MKAWNIKIIIHADTKELKTAIKMLKQYRKLRKEIIKLDKENPILKSNTIKSRFESDGTITYEEEVCPASKILL